MFLWGVLLCHRNKGGDTMTQVELKADAKNFVNQFIKQMTKEQKAYTKGMTDGAKIIADEIIKHQKTKSG